MSRYKPLLRIEQIKFIIYNPDLDNSKLGIKFGVSNSIIALYKYRLRKIGIDIPITKREWMLSQAVKDQGNE